MRLDIACGNAKTEGWTGIDKAALPGVDIVHDLNVYPWPIPDGTVFEARCSHYFEHVPGLDRPKFMEELWRVLAPGGIATILTPMGLTRQFQDFSHAWPVFLQSYLYFDSDWLKEVGLEHYRDLYHYRCNFKIIKNRVLVDPAIAALGTDMMDLAVAQWTNAAIDMEVQLQKMLNLSDEDEIETTDAPPVVERAVRMGGRSETWRP